MHVCVYDSHLKLQCVCVCYSGADVTLQLCAKQTDGCPECSISLHVRERLCEDINRLKAVIKSNFHIIQTMRIIITKAASHKSLGIAAVFGRRLLVGVDLTLRAASASHPLAKLAFLRPQTLIHVQLAHAHLDTRVTRHVPASSVGLLQIGPITGRSLRRFRGGLEDHGSLRLVDRWSGF